MGNDRRPPSLDHALEQHRRGRLRDAEFAYRAILEADPDRADAHHMLGVLQIQIGHATEGAESIEHSLALAPENAAAWGHLAEAKRQQAELDEADRLCRKAIAIDPRLASAHAVLAMVHHQRNRPDEALAAAVHAVELDPGRPEGPVAAGRICLDLGRPDEALAYLEAAARLVPHDSSHAGALAECHERLHHVEEALRWHRRAVELAPDRATPMADLGGLLFRLERHHEAIEWLERSIEKDPASFPALAHLGAANHALMEFEQAVSWCRRALAVRPGASGVVPMLGESLMGLGRFDECIATLLAALVEAPDAGVRVTLANALTRSGRLEEALDELARAEALEPAHPVVHVNRAIALLLMGRYAEAWPEYEWRWQHPRMGARHRHTNRARWQGEPLEGRRVLLHAEQGFGDTIMASRYLTMVAQRGGVPIAFVPASLAEVIRSIDGVAEVVAEGMPMPPFDCHLPMMSLPRVFGTTLDTVPARVPYVHAPPARSAAWKATVDRLASGRFKVGLVWRSGGTRPENFMRTAGLSEFAALAGMDVVAFFGLQKREAGDIAPRPPLGLSFEDLGLELHDFADTAAILDHLDLLISVDTSVAHLAGAMARPVWMLLPYSPGFMWMLERPDSPWYPTMRLFRQSSFGDWKSPMSQARAELERLVRR